MSIADFRYFNQEIEFSAAAQQILKKSHQRVQAQTPMGLELYKTRFF